MKTKSFLLAAVLAVVSIAGLAHGQTAPTSPTFTAPAAQKLAVSHVVADGFTATLAVVSAPRFVYEPTTATVTGAIMVVFYKDAAALASHLRPADFKSYPLSAAQVTSLFTPAAVTASSTLAIASTYLRTLPDFAGATVVP